MALRIPVATNYQSPITTFPYSVGDRPIPPEGSRFIPVDIDWSTMGGSAKCVHVSCYGGAAQTISRIAFLAVDNSRCSADVTIIFPDTQMTLTVPGYDTLMAPVFTSATEFFVSAVDAQASEDTSIVVHNTVPPPVSLDKSTFAQTDVVTGINIGVTGNTQLIPAGINGVLVALSIFESAAAAARTWNANIADGNGNVLAAVADQGSAVFTGQILNLPNMNVRFQNGLKVALTQTTAGTGSLVVQVFYRQTHQV